MDWIKSPFLKNTKDIPYKDWLPPFTRGHTKQYKIAMQFYRLIKDQNLYISGVEHTMYNVFVIKLILNGCYFYIRIDKDGEVIFEYGKKCMKENLFDYIFRKKYEVKNEKENNLTTKLKLYNEEWDTDFYI